MSSKQSSSIRVKTSKNPWHKKKTITKQQPQQISNTKKPQPNTSNDTDHWPDLQAKPSSNSTPSSTNIKDTISPSTPTQSNGHHVDNISSGSTTTKLQAEESNPSPTSAKSTTNKSEDLSQSPGKKKRKRKKKVKSNPNESNNTAMNTNDPKAAIAPHDPHNTTPKKAHKSAVSSVSISAKKDNNQHSPKNGYTLSRVHQDVAHRNYNNNHRRGNRGRRRGRGSRGGYRNNHNNYEDDAQEYQHRGYRNKRRFMGGNASSGAPRHHKERYRNHYNRNNRHNHNRNHNQQHQHHQHNNNYDMNMNNPNLWTQSGNMPFVAVPIMQMGAYQMPPVNNDNSKTKDGESVEEHKSDANASSGTSPQMMMPPIYNPYALNMAPILFAGQNMFGEPAIDTLHLMMNQMQQPPDWNGEVSLPLGPYYVLKVSCVATGYSADDRSVGHIALIDWNLKTKANIFVKPAQAIVSYIEPLTSLNAELLDKYGYSLEQAITIIKSELPSNAVLIGQNVTMDIQWLGLKASEDFKTFIDLRDVWRSWSEYYNSYTHYSLNHQAKCILNVENAHQQQHSASFDAITTMKLFQYYLYCRYYNMSLFHNKISVLSNTEIEASFAKRSPVYEGVQMQSKKYKGVPYITSTPKKILQQQTESTPIKKIIQIQNDVKALSINDEKTINATNTNEDKTGNTTNTNDTDNNKDDSAVVKVVEATKTQ